MKKAPSGYYTAREAQRKIGLSASTFFYYVTQGKIQKYVPPLRTEGFYAKKEIDALATEMALFFHTRIEGATETRVAHPTDAQGIYDVLDSFGWPTAPVALRHQWYAVNPYMDYVVIAHGQVMGYITAVPYRPDALEAMMSGQKRAWHITPEDILPYTPGETYDLYVGAATRQDVANHTVYAFRLISGFMTFLCELAEKRIFIRHMYAVSNQEDGQRLCRALGFVEQPPQEGDLFPRFMLDLQTSPSRFAIMYRESQR